MGLLNYLEYNSTISTSFTGTSISALVGTAFTVPERVSWFASNQAGTNLAPVTSRMSLYLWAPLNFSLISITSPAVGSIRYVSIAGTGDNISITPGLYFYLDSWKKVAIEDTAIISNEFVSGGDSTSINN